MNIYECGRCGNDTFSDDWMCADCKHLGFSPIVNCRYCGDEMNRYDEKSIEKDYGFFCDWVCFDDDRLDREYEDREYAESDLSDHEMYYHMRNENPYGMEGGY